MAVWRAFSDITLYETAQKIAWREGFASAIMVMVARCAL